MMMGNWFNLLFVVFSSFVLYVQLKQVMCKGNQSSANIQCSQFTYNEKQIACKRRRRRRKQLEKPRLVAVCTVELGRADTIFSSELQIKWNRSRNKRNEWYTTEKIALWMNARQCVRLSSTLDAMANGLSTRPVTHKLASTTFFPDESPRRDIASYCVENARRTIKFVMRRPQRHSADGPISNKQFLPRTSEIDHAQSTINEQEKIYHSQLTSYVNGSVGYAWIYEYV